MAKNAESNQEARQITKGRRRISLPKGITFERGLYRVRWKTPTGSRQSKSFRALEEAKTFKAQQRAEAALLRSMEVHAEAQTTTPVEASVVLLPVAQVVPTAPPIAEAEPGILDKMFEDAWHKWREVKGLNKRSARTDESYWRIYLGPAW